MSRAEQVRELLARPGATQASVAAELGLSRSQVCRLASGRTGNEARARRDATATQQPDATATQHGVQPPDATTQPAGSVQPDATTQPDLTALREQIRAEENAAERAALRADYEERWNALSAENANLRRQLTAGPADCPGCAALQADYEAAEAERDGLRRELSVLEDPC